MLANILRLEEKERMPLWANMSEMLLFILLGAYIMGGQAPKSAMASSSVSTILKSNGNPSKSKTL